MKSEHREQLLALYLYELNGFKRPEALNGFIGVFLAIATVITFLSFVALISAFRGA